jgi:hypothetical protein
MVDPTPTKMEDDESDIEMEGMDMNDDEDAVDEDAAENQETEAPEEEVKVDEHELESWRRLGRKGWISCAFMFYI